MANVKKNMEKQIVQNKSQDLAYLKNTIIEVLEKNKDELKKALPYTQNIQPERIIRIISTALTLNPTLIKCSAQSILGCAIQSAQLGLVPDSILGQCYFVPFYSSQDKTYKAQIIIGYRGLIDLIYRSGMVKSVYANVVRPEDEFEYEYGINQKLIHKPKPKDKASWSLNDIQYAYAYIYTVNGGFIFNVLDHNELVIIKSYSKTREEISVWNSRPNMASMKSAIRQIIKYAPYSAELRSVDMLESMYESNQGQSFDEIIEPEIAEKIIPEEIKEDIGEVTNASREPEKVAQTPEANTKGNENEGLSLFEK